MMDTFADYILEEEDLASKMEIVYYLSKKTNIFFDKSVVFKTELVRMFLNYSKIQVDSNLLLTASLLCNCKKVDNAQDLAMKYQVMSIPTLVVIKEGKEINGSVGLRDKSEIINMIK